MKAPDKIYVSRPIYNQCGLVISEDKPVEYICKDAILEWMKERKRLMEEEIGFRLSIDDVIDKLNSL